MSALGFVANWLLCEFPDVRATAEVVDTRDPPPAASLLAASEAADMLVVGLPRAQISAGSAVGLGQ